VRSENIRAQLWRLSPQTDAQRGLLGLMKISSALMRDALANLGQ
jgi:hypothetical protein